jgi:hypothetical protein
VNKIKSENVKLMENNRAFKHFLKLELLKNIDGKIFIKPPFNHHQFFFYKKFSRKKAAI